MTLIYFVRLRSDFASFNARLCSILPLFWLLVCLCSDLQFLFPIQGFFLRGDDFCVCEICCGRFVCHCSCFASFHANFVSLYSNFTMFLLFSFYKSLCFL